MKNRVVLIEPLPAHRFDIDKLFAYLAAHLEGFSGPASLLQFQGGQSNPTFLIETARKAYVLRKKPPGVLLPSAHQIQREYRIQKALEFSDVPVTRMLHWCGDCDIIGTEFYIMDYVRGRVFHESAMPGLAPSDRYLIQRDLIRTIAALHSVSYVQAGLVDYGIGNAYLKRQIGRWRKQYDATKTETLADMERLMDWLDANVPLEDEVSIVHGDFRIGNMIVREDEPRIVAVLDWELSTLGHPLADLAYCCMPYHMPAEAGPPYAGYMGLDLEDLGLMTEEEVLALYCKHVGRKKIENWPFFAGFSLFRSAAIIEGVYSRALAGNASDARALGMHKFTKLASSSGWKVVSQS